MKKRKVTGKEDDLRPEYGPEFFRNMKPNRFASETIVRKQQLVILDEDVAKVFDSSESVNTVLRSAIRAMRSAGAKRSSKRVASRRRV